VILEPLSDSFGYAKECDKDDHDNSNEDDVLQYRGHRHLQACKSGNHIRAADGSP